jgi:hypothetical protein
MEPMKKTGPRDVFSHLLAIIFLYVIIFNFGALLFHYIDFAFPDFARGDYFNRQSLRFPIAILVVVFPLYVWLTAFLQGELVKIPEKRDLKVRKWLLYFTLFLTTIVIVADLVSLIFRFLNGDFTIRFLLKVLVVLFLAGTVFLYYGWNLRKSVPASDNSRMKLFVRGAIVLGGVAILSGFFLVGSPQMERLRQIDEQRVIGLSTIQNEVVEYWRVKEVLPSTLDDLRDDIRGFIPPTDPETGEAYEYRTIDALSFELCAVFRTSTTLESGYATRERAIPIYSGFDENFLHEAARTCFSRTIDPDRIIPLKPLSVR